MAKCPGEWRHVIDDDGVHSMILANVPGVSSDIVVCGEVMAPFADGNRDFGELIVWLKNHAEEMLG